MKIPTARNSRGYQRSSTDGSVNSSSKKPTRKRGTAGSLGLEMVTNGAFAADTDWTKGASWTIAADVATSTGLSADDLSQALTRQGKTLIPGASYQVSGTTIGGTYGDVLDVHLGSTLPLAAIAADGAFSFNLVCGFDDLLLKFAIKVIGDFAGDLDGVSVKQIQGL